MSKVIGIDLGTTNSLSATVFNEGPEVIGTVGDSSTTPSVLTWTGSGWLVGHEARECRITNPENTIYSIISRPHRSKTRKQILFIKQKK